MKLPLFYTDSELATLDRDFLLDLYKRLKDSINVEEYRKRILLEIERKS